MYKHGSDEWRSEISRRDGTLSCGRGYWVKTSLVDIPSQTARSFVIVSTYFQKGEEDAQLLPSGLGLGKPDHVRIRNSDRIELAKDQADYKSLSTATETSLPTKARGTYQRLEVPNRSRVDRKESPCCWVTAGKNGPSGLPCPPHLPISRAGAAVFRELQHSSQAETSSAMHDSRERRILDSLLLCDAPRSLLVIHALSAINQKQSLDREP